MPTFEGDACSPNVRCLQPLLNLFAFQAILPGQQGWGQNRSNLRAADSFVEVAAGYLMRWRLNTR